MKYSKSDEAVILEMYPQSGAIPVAKALGRKLRSIHYKARTLGLRAPKRERAATHFRAHSSWQQMVHRCTNPNRNSYRSYGQKGISVCDAWMDFWTFLKDMGERPDGYSIDRIDPTKGYYPDNCRWIPRDQQKYTTRAALGIGQPKTGSPCIACNERPFVRRQRCHRCSEYFRKNGVERPSSGFKVK